jgi:hypothetical protein
MFRSSFIALAMSLLFAAIPTYAQSECSLVAIHCPLAGGCPAPTSAGKFQLNRVSPKDGKIRNHNGADYPGARGSEVRAASSGAVTLSETLSGFGKTVILRHSDGRSTLYAHLLSISVSTGQLVLAGEQLGKLDSTGRSTGNHLHLQYSGTSDAIRSKNLVDPASCLSLPAYSELVGTISFGGTVFNSYCKQNVEVRGTLEIKLRTEGVPQLEARVRRRFGPTCFTYEDDFIFRSDLVRLDNNRMQYFYDGSSDTMKITFTLSEKSKDVSVDYQNEHHFCCDNGTSNVGSQAGTGVIK